MSAAKIKSMEEMERELRVFGGALRRAADHSEDAFLKERSIREALSAFDRSTRPERRRFNFPRLLVAPQFAAALVLIISITFVTNRFNRLHRDSVHRPGVGETGGSDVFGIDFDGASGGEAFSLPDVEGGGPLAGAGALAEDGGFPEDLMDFPDGDFELAMEGEI